MKQLSKVQSDQLAACIKALSEAANDIDDAHGELEEAGDKLNSAISAYNEAVADAASFRDEIVAEMTDYRDERSERWQEGDTGQDYQAWIDEWEGIDLDSVDEDIDLPVRPDTEHADALESLPTEPG